MYYTVTKNKTWNILGIILALLMCLSFVSCSLMRITESDVKAALKDCDGTLNVISSGNYVTSFTYTIEDIYVEGLTDKSFCDEAMSYAMAGDIYSMSPNMIDVATAFVALSKIHGLFTEESEDFDAFAYVDEIFSIITNGETKTISGWKISAEVDVDNESITFCAKS